MGDPVMCRRCGGDKRDTITLGRCVCPVVIEFKTYAQNQKEFMRRWGIEYAEWRAIGDEMIGKAGPGGFVSAADVTDEQRRRMSERGETSVLESAFAHLAFGLAPARPRD